MLGRNRNISFYLYSDDDFISIDKLGNCEDDFCLEGQFNEVVGLAKFCESTVTLKSKNNKLLFSCPDNNSSRRHY